MSDDRDEAGPVWIAYPAYGPVESLLGFGLFYVVVDRLTPVVLTALEGVDPDLVPEPAGTAAAALLWLVFALTAVTVVAEQVRANPRRFPDVVARDAFLAANRPSAGGLLLAVALAAAGGTVAALTWSTALAVLEALVPVVVERLAIPAVLTFRNGLATGAFFVAFSAFTRGVDRLAIGGLRELIVRRYLGGPE